MAVSEKLRWEEQDVSVPCSGRRTLQVGGMKGNWRREGQQEDV